jgi:thioredoxin-like negative regulator of GroEL
MLTLYGRALLQEGDVEGAEHALRQATVRFPVEPLAFALYGSTAEKLNHLEPARQALIQYDGLTSNAADFAPRAARIASLSLRLNDPETAVRWLTRAAASSPNDVRLLVSLADAQIRADAREAAQATIARGLQKDPKNPALLFLGRRAR